MNIKFYIKLSLIAVVAFCAIPAQADDLDTLIANADSARAAFDEEASNKAYMALWGYVENNPEAAPAAKLALAEAALTYAEMRRFEYGQSDTTPEKKRSLGAEIDKAAGTGHDALKSLEDTSEKFRIQADLYATMIRTKYHGKRYAKRMDKAMEKALELDPKNYKAYVTACKRPLFATEKYGGDLDKAMELLAKSLELAPGYERALVMRGIAYEKLGDLDKAKADWNKVLSANPNSRSAKENLERIAKGEPVADFDPGE